MKLIEIFRRYSCTHEETETHVFANCALTKCKKCHKVLSKSGFW